MEMKLITRTHFPSTFFILTTLLASLLIPVMSTSFEDQKTYYSPDPHSGTPPSGGSHGSPPHHSTPSHGTPSHGGGGSYSPTPSSPTPSTPTPSDPTPSTPSVPNCGSPPHGGGGYYHSPPSSTTPSTPTVPDIPTPPTPIFSSPPSTPTPIFSSPPSTPTPIAGSPPFVADPNTPPFTCNYWRNHPGMIWGLVGWWGTLGHAFGVSSVPGFGSNFNMHQALSNTRTDGLGQLYREGTASLLNSMVYNKFPFTTKQVRESFVSALGSNNAAAAQARLFKLANEGRHKPRA